MRMLQKTWKTILCSIVLGLAIMPCEALAEEEKTLELVSEVSEDAKDGDIFKIQCVLSGYEEGTYSLQWQYITTDWYGNYTGEWINLDGAAGTELEVTINEENALKAWRVVLVENVEQEEGMSDESE